MRQTPKPGYLWIYNKRVEMCNYTHLSRGMSQSMQRWWHWVVFVSVSLWSDAELRLDDVGHGATGTQRPLHHTLKLSLNYIKLPRPPDSASQSPSDHSTMCGSEPLLLPAPVAFRVLRESVTWSRLTEQEPSSPSGLRPFHDVRVSELQSSV